MSHASATSRLPAPKTAAASTRERRVPNLALNMPPAAELMMLLTTNSVVAQLIRSRPPTSNATLGASVAKMKKFEAWSATAKTSASVERR